MKPFSNLRLCKVDNKFILKGKRFFTWITLPEFRLFIKHKKALNLLVRYPKIYNSYEEAYSALTQYKIELGLDKPEILYEATKDD